MKLLPVLLLTVTCSPLMAQDDRPSESDYFRMVPIEIPGDINLEAGAIEILPDGNLAVSTRRGDIYVVPNAFFEPGVQVKGKSPNAFFEPGVQVKGKSPNAFFEPGAKEEGGGNQADRDASDAVEFRPFAHGLHEVLGLTWKDGWLYATQRCEVTRMRDTDGDGAADEFQTFNDDWGINGDYHEYAFGSPFDDDGNMWVVLCLTGSFNSSSKYRGWCLRIDSDGNMIPTCSGIRSPGGIGFNAQQDVFYTDNQGPWNGTCSLKWLRPGSFQGHPGGNRWFQEARAKKVLGEAPAEPQSGSRIMKEADRIPEYEPPAILFPYKKMGQSASGVACDLTAGKFGPFSGQMFVGDQTFSTVMRCFLEQVDGHYQGACFPFREGFGSGTLSLRMTPDGSMFVGGTNRGWGSRGTKPYALDRLTWTGKVPFEIHEMHVRPDGFELTFTQPVDAAAASSPDSWDLKTYTYIFQSSYGSPEVDHTEPTITKAVVADDGQTVRLYIDGLQRGHVHELHGTGVKSAAGLPLLHDSAYYTLNYIPEE